MNNVVPFPNRIPPEFIEPTNLARMSDQEQFALLEQIRTRRMIAVTQYQTLMAERKRVIGEKHKKQYDSTIGRIASHIEKIDVSLARVEEYMHKLRGVRLEAMENADESSGGSEAEGSSNQATIP